MTAVTAVRTLTSESADSGYVTGKGDCPKHHYQCVQLSWRLCMACLCVGLCVCVEFSDWFVCMGQRGTGLVPSISQSLHKQSRYNEKDLCVREKTYRETVSVNAATFSTQTHNINAFMHEKYTLLIYQKDTQEWMKKKKSGCGMFEKREGKWVGRGNCASQANKNRTRVILWRRGEEGVVKVVKTGPRSLYVGRW